MAGYSFEVKIREIEYRIQETEKRVVIQPGCPLKIRGWRNAISNRALGTLLDMTTAGGSVIPESFSREFICGQPREFKPYHFRKEAGEKRE